MNWRVKKLRDKKSTHLVYEKSEKDEKKKSRLYIYFFLIPLLNKFFKIYILLGKKKKLELGVCVYKNQHVKVGERATWLLESFFFFFFLLIFEIMCLRLWGLYHQREPIHHSHLFDLWYAVCSFSMFKFQF